MERDQLAWVMKNCRPTAAQMAEIANCPFGREFEDYKDFSPSPSQSPTATPMTPIRMVSLPATQCSVDPCTAGEDAVLNTPPEHQVDSSLEDHNPNAFCAEKVTISEAKTGSAVVAGEESDGDTVPLGETQVVETEGDGGVGYDGGTVPLGVTEEVDESEGDGGVGFDGDTAPLGETEVVETEEDGGVGRTRVLSVADLELASWLEGWAASASKKRKIGGLMNNNGVDIENVEGIGGEEPNETSDSSGSSASCEIIGYKSCAIESGVFEKGVGIVESAERTARDGRKRKLSPSCKGKEKDAEDSCEIIGEKSVEMSKSAEEGAKVGRKRKLSTSKEKDAGCEIVGETHSGGLEKSFGISESAEKIAKDGHGNGGVRGDRERCKGKEMEAGIAVILQGINAVRLSLVGSRKALKWQNLQKKALEMAMGMEAESGSCHLH